MKKMGVFLVAVLFLLGTAVSAPAADYVGAKKCKGCHMKQFKHWEATVHAAAWDSLSPEEQAKAECVSCHATNGDAQFPGVQCESCHGAGSEYKSPKIKSKSKWKENPEAQRKLAQEAGLIMPDEKLCVSCHNPKAGKEFKGFNFAEDVEKVKHK